MNYKVEGNGNPIVFIHGLSDNLNYWESLTSSLKNDYKVIRYDLRGHGESELGNDELSIDLFTNDLHNLLDTLDVDKVNLVGFSLGGEIALDFAVKYPSRVSSLVLMSTASYTSFYAKNVLNEFYISLDKSFEDFYDYILPRILCPKVIDENKDELEFLKVAASQSADTEAYKKSIRAICDFDVRASLDELDFPVLVLAGKYDEVTPLEYQLELSNQIKNSELIVFDNVKHNLLVGENVLKITEILKDFIKK